MSTPVPANGIFFTEDEIREQYRKRLKGPSGGGANWYTDRVKGGISRDEDGNIQRSGLAWWLQGLEEEGFAKTAADRNKAISSAQTVEEAIASSDVDLDELQKTAKGKKITAKNVGNLIATTNRNVRNTPNAFQQAQIDQLQDQTSLAEAELQAVREQNANTLALARLDRADNMEARAADLEFRRDQMMLEDQRYNERLEREFQLRRKESMMAMMQGLASLGAAFAA
jgi:hypothetical protein